MDLICSFPKNTSANLILANPWCTHSSARQVAPAAPCPPLSYSQVAWVVLGAWTCHATSVPRKQHGNIQLGWTGGTYNIKQYINEGTYTSICNGYAINVLRGEAATCTCESEHLKHLKMSSSQLTQNIHESPCSYQRSRVPLTCVAIQNKVISDIKNTWVHLPSYFFRLLLPFSPRLWNSWLRGIRLISIQLKLL